LAKIPVFLLSMHGVAINMRNIPEGSVTEVIISFSGSKTSRLYRDRGDLSTEKKEIPTLEIEIISVQ
jgi:hypothetical protein